MKERPFRAASVPAKLVALAPAYFFFGRYFFSIDATTT